jgi:hypothetical protein
VILPRAPADFGVVVPESPIHSLLILYGEFEPPCYLDASHSSLIAHPFLHASRPTPFLTLIPGRTGSFVELTSSLALALTSRPTLQPSSCKLLTSPNSHMQNKRITQATSFSFSRARTFSSIAVSTAVCKSSCASTLQICSPLQLLRRLTKIDVSTVRDYFNPPQGPFHGLEAAGSR